MRTLFHAYRIRSLKAHRFLKLKGGRAGACDMDIINCFGGGARWEWLGIHPNNIKARKKGRKVKCKSMST